MDGKLDTIDGIADSILEDTGTTLPGALSTIAGYIDTEVAAIKAKTDNLPAVPAAQGDIPTAVQIRTEIDSNSTQLAAIVADTNELQTNQGNWLTADVSALATAADLATVDGIVDAILEDTGTTLPAAIDAIDNFVDTEVAAIKAVTDKLDTAVELDGAVYRFTTNALEQAPTGGSAPSAADIADAVWDEAISGHLGAGSTGAALNAAGSAGDPWTTELPGSYTGTQAGKVIADVKAKTDGLNFTGTDVKATLDGEEVDVGKVKAVPLTSVDDFKADTSNLALEATAQSIKSKTDNLPASPAASGEYTAALATIQADLDNPSQYKADVSALATSAELAALEAHGDANWGAGAVPSAADIADAVWDELIAAHTAAGTTGAALLAAGAAGDPNTSVPSAYTTGQIGYLIGEMAARLNTSNAVVLAALQGDPLNIRRGDTLSVTLTDLGTMTGYSEVWFTVKSAISHSDTEAVLQITTAGLQRINGAIGTAGNATLTVTDGTNGDVTITCAASEMAKLAIRNGLYYDLQVKIGTTVKTVAFGRVNIIEDVTKTI